MNIWRVRGAGEGKKRVFKIIKKNSWFAVVINQNQHRNANKKTIWTSSSAKKRKWMQIYEHRWLSNQKRDIQA